MKRRVFSRVAGIALGLAAATLSTAVHAQAGYPSGPVTIVVPWPAGGATDNLARAVAARLSKKWGQPVVVDNRAGNSGMIGAGAVARARPDGLTLLHTLSTLVQAQHLYPSQNFDAVRTLVPVSMSATNGLLWVVRSDFPAKTLQELVALVKANPGKYNYGSYGVGTTGHLYGFMFNSQAKLDMVHVGYKGEAPSVVDLLGGQVPMVIMSGNGAKSHIESGKMRVLAATGGERSLVAPNAPTFKELGYQRMDLNGWYGFFAPAGTPAAIVSKVSADINEILKDPEVARTFQAIDIRLLGTTPEDFAKSVSSHYELWGRIIKEAGVTAE